MISDQQVKGVGAGTNMTYGEQDHNEGYEAPNTDIIKAVKRARAMK